MAEEKEKRITISRTLNGNTIYYIARNSSGAIFARELTLEKLKAAIKLYKEPPPAREADSAESFVEPKEDEKGGPKKKFLTNKLSATVQEREKGQATPQTTTSDLPQVESEHKQFLENELQAKVEERKEQAASAESSGEPKEEKSQKKKSFWDKLK